jgi:hypothetical protein
MILFTLCPDVVIDRFLNLADVEHDDIGRTLVCILNELMWIDVCLVPELGRSDSKSISGTFVYQLLYELVEEIIFTKVWSWVVSVVEWKAPLKGHHLTRLVEHMI